MDGRIMNVRYLLDVSTPEQNAGKVGDIRELDEHVALILIAGGYVVEHVVEEKKSGKVSDKRKDS
jgi:hypothetical protein